MCSLQQHKLPHSNYIKQSSVLVTTFWLMGPLELPWQTTHRWVGASNSGSGFFAHQTYRYEKSM